MTAHQNVKINTVKNALTVTFCLSLESVCAQTAPGDISRQVEPVRVPALPALQMQPQRITQPSAPEPGSPVVRVQQWDLQGQQVLRTDALQRLLQPFVGVDLSLQQIREAAAVVQQAYEDAGWLARVDIPQQDATDGRIRLVITEARLGEVRLDAQSATRVRPERLLAWVRNGQAEDAVFNTRRLERGLLIADDLPGVSVAGTLQASARPGATDVILTSAAESPYKLDLGLDNHSARTVGASRLSVSGSWSSPLGYGESFSAQALKSQGSDFLRVGSTVPLGYGGWRGGMHLSQLDFAIITPDADGRAQNIQGRSQSAGLDLSYPLVRSRQANMFVTAAIDHRLFLGNANGLRNSDYSVQGGNIGLAGNFFDSWAGKTAANSYSLEWRRGVVQDGSVPVLSAVEGRFSKLNWSLSRQQTLRSDLSLYTVLSGQKTGDKVLDGSENFSLGGPSRVRAYAVSEATGPQGQVLNLELRWRLNPQWLVTPFYDHGRIQKRSADALRDYSLSGAGVSVTWTGPQGWTASTTLAQRLGRNPNANAQTGRDQDGSLHKTRLWLALSRSL